MRKHLATYVFCLIALVAGIVAGWYVGWYVAQQSSRVNEIRENSDKYHFINPLLLVDTPRQAQEYNDLKNLISDFTVSEKSNNDASDISVYFRDLNSGRWIGVDPDSLYDPSSMLKVAVMMGYLDEAGNDPSVLDKKLVYTSILNPGQNYKPEHPLKSGSYSVKDLIETMIIDSDNNALDALYANDRQAFVGVLKDLEIPPPSSIATVDFMSAKTYSSLFRTLYSATYISRLGSEQALQLLAFTNFKKGLTAGVPSKIIVSHKFGEHTTVTNLKIKSRQLHDCGIIYYPRKPYLLCVMTRGQDFSKLENIISGISSLVYKNISSQ